MRTLKKKNFTRMHILKKKLKLKDVSPSITQKKFIIVQIDGLSYSLLQKLRETRFIPFLSELLQEYSISKYDPGYPTTTPFVQAGLLYNDNHNIPGFRFMDKKTHRFFNCGLSEDALFLEGELEKKDNGVLRGGTSIGTIFCGQALRSILTVSHIYKTENGTKNARDIVSLIFLNPLQTLRVIWVSIVEFFIEWYDSLVEIVTSILNGKHFNWPFIFPYFPFFRTFINATAREICTQTGLLDMDRNVPYIYVAYGGYDWISHYRGPNSLSAFHLLNDIDVDTRKLYKLAKKNGYDFYVYSDHGQVPSIPFDRLYYESFESFVQKISKLSAKGYSSKTGEWNWTKYISYKLEFYFEHLSYPFRTVSRFLFHNIKRLFFIKNKDEVNWKKKDQIILLYSSSLAHLYFGESTKRLQLHEMEKKYPGFVDKLISHPGVGFVIVKNAENVLVLNSKGKVILMPGKVKFEGEHFLSMYGDEHTLVKKIRAFAELKYSGDIIVNGAFDGERIVAFEFFHFGSHDSIGGKQSDAFFISRDKINLSHVLNAKELYHIFEAYHHAKDSKKDL